MKRVAVLVATLASAAMVLLAACGGSGAKTAATATVTAAQSSGGTPVPAVTRIAADGSPVPIGTGIVVVGSPVATPTPTPFSDAQKTAVALGKSVPFADYTDPAGRFVVGLPVGWTLVVEPTGVGARLAGAPFGADLGVFCATGITVSALITADQALLKQVGEGNMTLDKEFATTVAGITAREIPWQGAYAGQPQGHWYVYFEAKGCTWRLLLNTYPGVNADDMLAIFQRMLGSFRVP